LAINQLELAATIHTSHSANMNTGSSISSRFRDLRERAGLSIEEAAKRMGVSPFHIETDDAEFTQCYSPSDALNFCKVLDARPAELFDIKTAEPPISATSLVLLVHQEYRARGLTLEQFEDIVGWRLSACIEPPEHLFDEMSIDGLQWLCRELGVDWHRVILSL
jgi:transcriptional regulator with XRE-family HTH domain